MTDINNISEEFAEFIFIGLDHGVESIKDGGGPLVPFVMIQNGEEKSLNRILTDKLEEGQPEAEKFIKGLNPKPKLALIAFDGFVTIREEWSDAIVVRSFDLSEEQGLIFAQRYIPNESGVGITPVGNVALIGYEENLLRSNSEITQILKKKPWWKFY